MDYWHHGTESQESWDDPGNEYKGYAQNYGSHGQDYGEQTTAYGSWGEDSKELMFFLFFFFIFSLHNKHSLQDWVNNDDDNHASTWYHDSAPEDRMVDEYFFEV